MSSSFAHKTVVISNIQGIDISLERDREFANAMIRHHGKLISSHSNKFNGEIKNYDGNGIACIFDSSEDAVNFATELQVEYREYPRIPVRFGIDKGEITIQGNNINGTPVTIASKIARSAKSGSVVLSSRVQKDISNAEEIRSKFIDVFEWEGEMPDVKMFAIAEEQLVVPESSDIKAEVKPLSRIGRKGKSSFKHILISIVTLVLASAFFAYLNVLGTDAVIDDYSIAVLPFDNLSQDEEGLVYSEGFSNNILHRLALIEDLKVISDYTVSRYSDSEKTNEEIAKDLGVAFVLKGKFHRFGENLRVTTTLIDAISNDVVWTNTYNRNYSEIMLIESEISKDIVDALRLRLSFDDMQDVVGIPTGSVEAYDLFLKGKYEQNKLTALGNRNSIDYYSRAIRIDTSFALAYTSLARSILNKTKYEDNKIQDVSTLAELYLERAENLNDRLGEIYSLRGRVKNLKGELDESRGALDRALDLAPNDVYTRIELATYYYKTNQPKKQLVQNKAAYQLDPLNFETASAYVSALVLNEKFDEADELLNKIANNLDRVDPVEMERQHVNLYLAQQNYRKAILPLIRMSSLDSTYLGYLGYSYAKIGDNKRTKDIIDSLKNKQDYPLKSYNLATVYSGLGQKDSVTKYLDSLGQVRAKTRDSIYHLFN